MSGRPAALVIGLVALGLGVSAGLWAGAASAGRLGQVPATRTGAARSASPRGRAGTVHSTQAAASASTAARSMTTATQPTVTAVQLQPPPATLPGSGRPVVHVGDMNTPEQFIIGQLYQLALQNEGYTVQLSRNVGPPSVRVAALKQGTLDIYPEYLGQWNSRVAHLHRRFGTLRASYMAGAAYARRHGYVLLPPTPFSDTSCLAVLSQYAQFNHVYTLPELAHGQPVIIGAPSEFQDIADGLPAVIRTYGLRPAYIQNIGVTLQYWWLGTGDVQAAYCTTTDPQLSNPRYVQLTDPRHVFGFGNVVPVTTPRVLAAEGPAFARTIERVDALLTLRAMRGLNAEYEFGGHSATQIAFEFLQGNGILPPSLYAPVQTTSTQAVPSPG